MKKDLQNSIHPSSNYVSNVWF